MSEPWCSVIAKSKHMLWINFESNEMWIAYKSKIQKVNAWIGVS